MHHSLSLACSEKLLPNRLFRNQIPPLEWELKLDNVHKVQKTEKFIKAFLNDLRCQPEIWSSDYVVNFLSMKDDKRFADIMKFSEVTNLTGTLEARITPGTYLYKEELDKFLVQADKIYKKLHQDTKKIKKDFQQASSTLYGIGEQFHEMFTQFNEFDTHIIDGREGHQGLKNSYVSFNNILMSWGKSLEQQAEQISDW